MHITTINKVDLNLCLSNTYFTIQIVTATNKIETVLLKLY